MERNDGPNAAEPGGTPEANEFSGSGARPIEGFDFSGSTGLTGNASPTRTSPSSMRDKLADVLESGAGRLRERGARDAGADSNTDTSAATFAGVTGGGTVALETDGRTGAHVSERVAGGMDAAANWIREADIDGLRQGIERQVKEHPARTLIIAAGIGYLLGRAFRTNR
jgi:hypothetical protein